MSAHPAPIKAADPAQQGPGVSPWQAAGRRLLRRPTAIFSAIYIGILMIVSIFAEQIAPYAYDFQNYDKVRVSPLTPGYLLGTDQLGRDILSRMIYGTRVSMSVAFVVLLIGLTVGLTLGCLAGYYGGITDMVIMRLTDIMFAFPDLLLAILIMGIRGPGITNLYIALGVVAWPGLARLVRGQIYALRESEYVLAARAVGNLDHRIIIKHLIPNLMSTVLVSATLSLAGVILSEAVLSFLGIGIRPPYPSWGSMLNEMVTLIYSHPTHLIGPSLILALTILSFNFLGDGLRDALDPRMKN